MRGSLTNLLACAALSAFLSLAQAQTTTPAGDQADDFFGRSTVEEIQLAIHPDDWQKLRDNYLSNDYYPAILSWRDHILEPVGIRSRGRGSRNPEKPGIRVDFNRFEDLSFLGLSGLVLDNMTQDPPQLREVLAMGLFRRLGVPAPRTLYVRLVVNGQPYGLYLAEEEVAKPFLKLHFGENDGDLFEYSWTDVWHWEPRGESADSYIPDPFSPKTHEKKPNAAALMTLIGRLNETDPATADEDLADIVDWDEVLRFLAVDWYAGDFDGFTGDLGTNNFYLYRSGADKKWRLIPWDKDATFVSKDFELFRVDESGVENRWIRLVKNNPALLEQFRTYCRQLAEQESPWLLEQAELNLAISQAEAMADTVRPWDSDTYLTAIEEIFYVLRERPAAALAALDPKEEPGEEVPGEEQP